MQLSYPIFLQKFISTNQICDLLRIELAVTPKLLNHKYYYIVDNVYTL